MDKFYKNIKQLIENNLVEVKKNEIKNNYHTLKTYHQIGKLLFDAQDGKSRAKYGSKLIKEYSVKLANEYGRKYGYRNLMLMRQLYITFKNEQIVQTLSAQLNFSHFQIILPIKDKDKRNYYINSIVEHNFSVRQLKEYIKSNAYERLVKKDNIKLKYIDNSNVEEPDILDMIKNPIRIIINKSVDKITEKALKKFMLEQIEVMMLELGRGFAFVGSEVPIKINKKILRPDLVFFNIELNCYIILELKLNELTIKDIGQIEFYIKYYDSDRKKLFHNPTIGITISKKVDRDIIRHNKKKNIEHSIYELIEK